MSDFCRNETKNACNLLCLNIFNTKAHLIIAAEKSCQKFSEKLMRYSLDKLQKMKNKSNVLNGILFDVYNTLVKRKKSDFSKLLELLPYQNDFSKDLQEKAIQEAKEFYRLNRHLKWALTNNLSFWIEYYKTLISVLKIPDENSAIATQLANWSREPTSFSITKNAFYVLNSLKKRGYKIGLLSNWDVSLSDFCNALGLSKMVDIILASDEIGIRKPAPEIFKVGCQRINIPPNQVLFVGDSFKKDMEGASNIGMKTAWFNTNGKPKPATSNNIPDFIMSDLIDLLPKLPKAPTFLL